jgi:hypothetical protein
MSVFVSVRSDVETKMTSSSADGGRRVAEDDLKVREMKVGSSRSLPLLCKWPHL